MREVGKGLLVGVLIWALIGAAISGATWRLYDIAWLMVAVPLATVLLFALAAFDAIRRSC